MVPRRQAYQLFFLVGLSLLCASKAFYVHPSLRFRLALSSTALSSSVETAQDATQILAEWDRYSAAQENAPSHLRERLADAVRLLSQTARDERDQDQTKGRCMLGICAASTAQGIATLKSWVSSLELPRGLLHGMDVDGVPVEIDGGVYIKYNTGGSLTFEDIRKSGGGFESLWKPGDAMLEPYDGKYRGVYFQVELSDGEFRQFLVPLDTFDEIE